MIARCWESIRGRVWLAGLVTALLLGLVGPVVADVFTDDDGGFMSLPSRHWQREEYWRARSAEMAWSVPTMTRSVG